jgi:hypothetical protein
MQQCSDDQEKTRQALEDPQKFTTASTDLQRCRDDQEKTRQELETLQEFTTASTDLETRKDLQQRRDDQEKTRQELETLREELRDTKAQHATQLAALRQEHESLKVVHADTVEDLQVKMREAELADQKIEMYRQARSEVLQFLYRSVMLRPDAFTDDEASSVLEITRRRLGDCKDAKDRIDSVHTTKFDELNAAYVSLEKYTQTISEWLERTKSVVSTRNSQISELKRLATTQESAHRTALQERSQLALALRDTSARYKEMVEFVESMSLE